MQDNPPRHIAIILDGNRRYAKKLGLRIFDAHNFGAEKVKKLFDWCMELGIKEITLYTFSMENFERDKREVDYLMNLFRKWFSELIESEDVKKEKIRFNFIGRIGLFPNDLQGMMREISEKTKQNKGLIVNFAIGYSGRAEIIDAVKGLIKDVQEGKLDINKINEVTFKDYLYLSDEPGLIIRTGGEIRVSNFLIYQSAYSELVFMKKLWPEISKQDIINAIEEYKRRERRFGK